MEQETIKATLTMGNEKRLTLRLFLNDKQKELFILEKGRLPNTTMDIILL